MSLTRGQILSQPIVQDNSSTSGGSITFRDVDLSNQITLGVANDVTTSYTITLPSEPPAGDGYGLSFTSAGVASFAQVAATPGGSVAGAIQYRTAQNNLEGTDYVVYNSGDVSLDINPTPTQRTLVRWYDQLADGFAAFRAPSDITRSYTVDLPTTIPGNNDGDANGYVLKVSATSGTLTQATLEWGPPVTGDNQSQGPQYTVQLAGDVAGEFASPNDDPAYNSNNYLTYDYTNTRLTINSSVGNGSISIYNTTNSTDNVVLTQDTLGSTVVDSSLTSLGTLTGLTINNTITTPTDIDLLLSPAGAGDVVITGNQGTSGGKVDLQDAQVTPNVLGIVPVSNLNSSYNITLPAANVSAVGDKVMSFDSTYNASYVDNRKTINFCFDGGGITPLQVGPKGFIRIDGSYRVSQITLLTDDTDTMTVNVTKATFANFPSLSAFLSINTSNSTKASTSFPLVSAPVINDGDILDFEIISGTTPFTSIFATVSLTLLPIPLS